MTLQTASHSGAVPQLPARTSCDCHRPSSAGGVSATVTSPRRAEERLPANCLPTHLAWRARILLIMHPLASAIRIQRRAAVPSTVRDVTNRQLDPATHRLRMRARPARRSVRRREYIGVVTEIDLRSASQPGWNEASRTSRLPGADLAGADRRPSSDPGPGPEIDNGFMARLPPVWASSALAAPLLGLSGLVWTVFASVRVRCVATPLAKPPP